MKPSEKHQVHVNETPQAVLLVSENVIANYVRYLATYCKVGCQPDDCRWPFTFLWGLSRHSNSEHVLLRNKIGLQYLTFFFSSDYCISLNECPGAL